VTRLHCPLLQIATIRPYAYVTVSQEFNKTTHKHFVCTLPLSQINFCRVSHLMEDPSHRLYENGSSIKYLMGLMGIYLMDNLSGSVGYPLQCIERRHLWKFNPSEDS